MRMMQPITGLAAIAGQYDVLLLDQFGVLHNGAELLSGVEEALGEVHAMGKAMFVLSNTSKRQAALEGELPGRGFRAEWLTGAKCSGEECWQALRREWTGKKCLFLGWTRDESDARYLRGTGLELATAQEADVVVLHGPNTLFSTGVEAEPTTTDFMDTGDSTWYSADFTVAAQRGLPMLCANPDLITVDPVGRQLYMPGTLANAYRALGGRVVDFGKPDPSLFQAAIEAARVKRPDLPASPKVLHVGDSLHHDIAGAAAAAVDSLFVVSTGVHQADLPGWQSGSTDAIADLAATLGTATPTYVIDKFRW